MKASTISSLCVLVLLASVAVATATPSFTGNYTQDFNSMGTGTTAPDGWAVYSIAGSHDQFKPVDDPSGSGALPTSADIKGGTANATLIAATPDTTTTQKGAQGYNWAIGGSYTERALGTSPSGDAAMMLQLTLANNSGAALNSISVAYDVRVLGTTTNNNNNTTNNYIGIEELPGYQLWYSLDNGTTYTNVTALNANGHTWANALGTVHESASDLTLPGMWNNGSNIMLRWFDDNAQGPSPDQRLGLDNVTITPEPATMSLLVLGGLASLIRRR